MVGINELTVNFGERYLFNKISFIINNNDRIGLVGKNGAGKSTLLKIIAGQEESDGGNISSPSGYRVGYLPQDMDFDFGKTVMEEAKSVFKEVNAEFMVFKEETRFISQFDLNVHLDSKFQINFIKSFV